MVGLGRAILVTLFWVVETATIGAWVKETVSGEFLDVAESLIVGLTMREVELMEVNWLPAEVDTAGARALGGISRTMEGRGLTGIREAPREVGRTVNGGVCWT